MAKTPYLMIGTFIFKTLKAPIQSNPFIKTLIDWNKRMILDNQDGKYTVNMAKLFCYE